jgi:hypothetical protein
MNNDNVVGLQPWLPWPLSRWSWWTQPVRAERLAALRIGLGIVLLIDVFVQYLPHYADFFGADSLGSPEVFAGRGQAHWHWSLLRGIEDSQIFLGVLIVWGIAGVMIVFGLWPRLGAVIAWALSVSVLNLNYYIHNGGDRIRTIGLFYLMLCPCGAVWSVQSWFRRKGHHPSNNQEGSTPPLRGFAPNPQNPVYISPWALRLLFIQMCLIYFFNGFYKLLGPHWRAGDLLQYVVGNIQWSRWSFAMLPVPFPLIQALTWTVLIWELGFPLWVGMRPLRNFTLWLGVLLHLGLAAGLHIGLFSFYMLCLYLPLVPWERYVGKPSRPNANPESL